MTLRTAVMTLLVLASVGLCVAPPALAATSTQIHRDALDGSIDGNYTLSELREADRTVGADQREYFGWPEVYAVAVRRLTNPDAKNEPRVVVPIDKNKNGMIDPEEQAAAVAKQKTLDAKAGGGADSDVSDSGDEEDAAIAAVRNDDKDDADDADPSGWLVALLIAVPLAIIGLGVWRMQRTKRDREDVDSETNATSTFQTPDGE